MDDSPLQFDLGRLDPARAKALPIPRVPRASGEAVLVVGTDDEIGRRTMDDPQERRVGIVPADVKLLIDELGKAGVSCKVFAVKGAGERCGFADEAYEKIGAAVVPKAQLANLSPRPHVFHALKEPCGYEEHLRGPFVRIGALHTGEIRGDGGLARLLAAGQCHAIIDGSSLGGFAYRYRDPDLVASEFPLRQGMSWCAGLVAARRVKANRGKNELKRVVLFGGGVVGTAVAYDLLNDSPDQSSVRVTIYDRDAGACERLRRQFGSCGGRLEAFTKNALEKSDLEDADALVLSPFNPGRRSPKVVEFQDILEMSAKAAIVDVSIDETGSIHVPGLEDAGVDDYKSGIESRLAAFNRESRKELSYLASSHLPTELPEFSSELHSKSVTPYLFVLLYMAARHGLADAVESISSLRPLGGRGFDPLFDGLRCDLHNGLAFCRHGEQPLQIVRSRVADVKGAMAALTEAGRAYFVD